MSIFYWIIFISAVVKAAPVDDFLTYTFFDNYDTVWPDNVNKLAYMFFAAVSDNSIANSSMFVLDGRLVIDPSTPPNDELKNSLIAWINASRFDPNIKYYQILKELEETTYDVSVEELVGMVSTLLETIGTSSTFKPPSIQNLVAKSKNHRSGIDKRQNRRKCESNFFCLSFRGDCLCTQTSSGKYCESVIKGKENTCM